jgi:periplasmic protein TonB
MTLEVQRVSRVSEDDFGSLGSCLVEGDPQSERRARRIKQRAVAISIVLQSLALVALVLFPLLSKGARMTVNVVTPLPPYQRGIPHPADPGARRPNPRPYSVCHFCPPPSIPNRSVLHDPPPTDVDPLNTIPVTPIGTLGESNGTPFGADGLSPRRGPERPIEDPPKTVGRQRVSEMQQMAQLVTRVDPIYPPFAIQIHREGRVELHAIISTTGTIESLEVISGDPFFISSALAAVREWRYRPTILNGRPIEVDTCITVIYTLSH